MSRLDSDERLSAVLPAVKNLAQLVDDEEMVAFLNLAMYGLEGIPGKPTPFTESAYGDAVDTWANLAAVRDPKRITTRNVLKRGLPERDKIVTVSIFELEQYQEPAPLVTYTIEEIAERSVQQAHAYRDSQNVINRVRAHVYDYASVEWVDRVREKDRIKLLGQDYHIVLESLGALNTEVGKELAVALDQLRSENLAAWSLSAVGCRAVVLNSEGFSTKLVVANTCL